MSDSSDESEGTGGAEATGDDLDYCARCGATLPDEVWCPVRTEREPDGTVRIRSFCDETCLNAWLAAEE
ncbi:DUF7576 family protein [Halovivax limisalsi]|uniref:DUF7576 family protein n=1 Tax=Halovivax limisalsi TaxID=1453760 RepID=UPI001FFC7888|nr:hypothetical protein [Halovivax limisalsi]